MKIMDNNSTYMQTNNNINRLIIIGRNVFRYPRYLYVFSCAFLSLISAIICFTNSNVAPSCYKFLWLLPAGHFIISALLFWAFFKGDLFEDLPVFVITLLFTLRNAFTPMMMALNTYSSRLGIPSSIKMVNIGVAVYLYETLAVCMVMLYHTKKISHRKKIKLIGIKFKDNCLFYFILGIGFIVSISSFVLLPELSTQYYSIFTSGITQLAHETVIYSGGIKRALSTVSGMVIEATRLTLSSLIIFKLRKRGEKLSTYFLSILVILLQFLFINDSNAYIIMLALALYLLVYKLFPAYGKRTMRYFIIIVIAFGTLMYINRFSKDIYGKSLSIFLQAYIPGLANFSGIEPLLDRNVFDIINQILIDLYAAVPFRSTLFGYKGGLISLPTLWNSVNGVSGQILPNIAQSYYYFGPIFCPILSMLLTIWALNTFKKAKKTNNPCLYSVYMYLTIYICISITMYDFYIFFKALLSRVLFMWIFSYFFVETFNKIHVEKENL